MDSLGPPTPKGSFIHPLLISLGIVVCISLLILAYHVLVVKFCLSRRRRSIFNDSFTIPMHENELNIGIDENILKTIPIFIFSKENIKLQAKIDHINDQNECVICLGEIEDGEKVRSLPNCGHIFHVPCIDDWLSAHTNCPICRAPIIPSPIFPSSQIGSFLEVSPRFNNIGTRDRISPPNLGQFLEQREEDIISISNTSNFSLNASSSSSSSSTTNSTNSTQSRRKLLHSLSLILPMEGKKENFTKLKRSLSMDECFVIIDIEEENDREKEESPSCSSSSSSSSSPSNEDWRGVFIENKLSYKVRSKRQLDRVSSRLIRSFSQIRFGENSI